jgi:hypothetical protein
VQGECRSCICSCSCCQPGTCAARSSTLSSICLSTGAQAVQVDQQLLQWLAELYAAVGQLDPRWDVVPCLECAGWTSGVCAHVGCIGLVACLDRVSSWAWRSKGCRAAVEAEHPAGWCDHTLESSADTSAHAHLHSLPVTVSLWLLAVPVYATQSCCRLCKMCSCC